MSSEIKQFVLESLSQMNYDVDDVTDDTTLGPSGADLESLAIAELAVRVEDRFGVKFTEDEAEELAGMTIGEFATAVASRLTTSDAGELARMSGE
jgi:acyl carrier protein